MYRHVFRKYAERLGKTRDWEPYALTELFSVQLRLKTVMFLEKRQTSIKLKA